LPTLASCKTSINADEYAKGKLTVATDTPAYTPWFVNNTPSNGKGYESGVAYAIAKELGVKSPTSCGSTSLSTRARTRQQALRL